MGVWGGDLARNQQEVQAQQPPSPSFLPIVSPQKRRKKNSERNEWLKKKGLKPAGPEAGEQKKWRTAALQQKKKTKKTAGN